MVSKIKSDLTNSIKRTETRDVGKSGVGARESSILVLAFICALYFQEFRNSHIFLTMFFMYYSYYLNFNNRLNITLLLFMPKKKESSGRKYKTNNRRAHTVFTPLKVTEFGLFTE